MQDVDIASVAEHVLPQPTLFKKSASAISSDRPFIVSVNPQPDAAQIAITECIVDEKPDSLATVATAPVGLIANSYSELSCSRRFVDIEQGALACECAVDLDGEPGAVATTFGRLFIKFGFKALK
jgi:hypothetical protein